MTNSDISNSIVSYYFGNQDSISAHLFELDQTQTFENHIDILASYPFPEIELEHEYDPKPQLGNSISLPDSKMTPISLLDFNPFPEPTLDHVTVHREIESPIFYDHHIELDQFYTFESPIDKLASSHFYEIELNEECDLDSQICDPVQISESILTLILLPDFSNILESVLILIPVILELESPILEVTFHCGKMNVDLNFNFLIWTEFLNQLGLLNLYLT